MPGGSVPEPWLQASRARRPRPDTKVELESVEPVAGHDAHRLKLTMKTAMCTTCGPMPKAFSM